MEKIVSSPQQLDAVEPGLPEPTHENLREICPIRGIRAVKVCGRPDGAMHQRPPTHVHAMDRARKRFADAVVNSEADRIVEPLGQQMPEPDKEQFVRLMATHGRRLYAYVLSLVPNWADADEIFQETSVRLWRDFADFEPNSNFSAWATRVAYFQVLTWRKRAARSQLVFDDDILQLIAARHEMRVPFAETRHRALGDCLQELNGSNRDLLARCYAPGAQVKDVAESMGRKLPAVYKSLQRIRAALRDCVERRLKSEGVT